MLATPIFGAITPQRSMKKKELKKKPGIAASMVSNPYINPPYMDVIIYYFILLIKVQHSRCTFSFLIPGVGFEPTILGL